jgi:hypothetical protein
MPMIEDAGNYKIEKLPNGQLEVQHKGVNGWDFVARVKDTQRGNDVIDDLRHGRKVRDE